MKIKPAVTDKRVPIPFLWTVVGWLVHEVAASGIVTGIVIAFVVLAWVAFFFDLNEKAREVTIAEMTTRLDDLDKTVAEILIRERKNGRQS